MEGKHLKCSHNSKGDKIDSEIFSELRVPLPCTPINEIRVLVVYTQAALNIAGSASVIYNRIQNGIVGFNSAVSICGCSPNAYINLAGIEFTNFTEVSPGAIYNTAIHTSQFTNLINQTQLRKSQTAADIVFCATDGNYTNTGGAAFDVLNSSTINNATTYCFAEIDFMPNEPVFQHEIGHLLGGRHDTDSTPGSMHGIIYAGGTRATLMVPGAAPGTQRPNRWSSAIFTDGKHSTGNSTWNNVAGTITANAPIMSNVATNSVLYTAINGPNNVYSIGTRTYNIDYGCSSGHTFQWFTSSDGFNYSFVGSGPSHVKFFYPGMGAAYYVKCVTSTPDGQLSTSFKTTNLYISSNKLKNNNQDGVDEVTILNNPTTNDLIFGYTSSQNNKYNKASIVDLNGQAIIQENLDLEKGISKRIDISKLTTGNYLILMSNGTNTISKQFTKVN